MAFNGWCCDGCNQYKIRQNGPLPAYWKYTAVAHYNFCRPTTTVIRLKKSGHCSVTSVVNGCEVIYYTESVNKKLLYEHRTLLFELHSVSFSILSGNAKSRRHVILPCPADSDTAFIVVADTAVCGRARPSPRVFGRCRLSQLMTHCCLTVSSL